MSPKGALYDASSDLERLYFINKIPYRYWKSDPSKVSFTSMSYTPAEERKIRVAADVQDKYYNNLVGQIGGGNLRDFAGSFICISSSPSEEHSMNAGFALVTSIIKADPTANVGVVDLSLFHPVDKGQVNDIVLIHNVTCDSTRDRIQHARDYVNWAVRSALCVLCTSGRNPLEMCYEVLRMPANMVLFSDERSSTRVLDY